MTDASGWQQARKLLCVRLDNMGDVIMTTPALHALKHGRPDRSLTLLASGVGTALAPYLADVDDVLTYDAPWAKHPAYDAAADLAIVSTLRDARFDAAVIFTVYSQNPLPAALMCRLAGIPRVLAYCRENPYELISDWQRETEPQQQIRHEVQRQLDLVGCVGARTDDTRLRFATRGEDRLSLQRKLAGTLAGETDSWLVAHCGASAESRRYPGEYFARALQMVGADAGPIVLTGGAGERALVQEIMRTCGTTAPLIDMAGELSLGEFACLLEDASLLLSNNTGPVHLAAALGTPVVDLYALTNPQHTPWQVPNRVLFKDVPCRNCYRSVCPEGHHECLRGVSPRQVRDAVLELLAETRGSSVQPLAGIA